MCEDERAAVLVVEEGAEGRVEGRGERLHRVEPEEESAGGDQEG